MTILELNVKGMHCASCEELIKDALEEQDGIAHAKASEKDGKVIIDCNRTKVSIGTISKIIEKEGFEVIR